MSSSSSLRMSIFWKRLSSILGLGFWDMPVDIVPCWDIVPPKLIFDCYMLKI